MGDEQVTAARAAIDQLAAIARDAAQEPAAYWRALRRLRVPWWLAAVLTVQWHKARHAAQLEVEWVEDDE